MKGRQKRLRQGYSSRIMSCSTNLSGTILEVAMSAPSADHHPTLPLRRPKLSVDELIKAKNAKPIRSLADLEAMAADVFESDEELDEFLAFTYAERRRDVA